jgi:DnaJ-class molecular chaperone
VEYIACGLAMLLVVAAALITVAVLRRRATRPPAVTSQALCLNCHGSGWIQEPERTLTFTGEGFTDVHRPARMCAACDGTGRVRR